MTVLTRDDLLLVDPELLDLLHVFPTMEITTDTLEGFRAISYSSKVGPDAAAAKSEVLQIEGPAGAPDILVRIHVPVTRGSSDMGCILHLHGGGFIRGSSASREVSHRNLVASLNCALVSVDYRWAPETPYPGSVEDCYAALCWVASHSRELNVDLQRIGVMGESAGGGLAASLALLARDRGGPTLAFQHLSYPMLDDRTGATEDSHPFAGKFVWTAANNRFGWEALLGTRPGQNGVSPYAAAARAADLAGLPPAFILTGALDLFADEDIDYARRLARAGVPVELHLYARAFHGFDLHPTARVARAARRDSFAALKRFLEKS